VRDNEAIAVRIAVPMLEPTTVTLSDAVTGMFVGSADDG
jgi:hypothetical protein